MAHDMTHDDLPDLPDLLARVAERARPTLRAVSDAQLDLPTPCAEYDLRQLLNHLLQVVVEFQKLARGESADFAGTPELVVGDWRDRFDRETRQLVDAWSRPGALEGAPSGMGLPRPVVLQLVLLDLTVHPWDVARATGGDFTPEGSAVARLLPTFTEMAPMARSNGVFGAEVPVPEDAPPFSRLLGLTGRDPEWRPTP
ncbi:TIGR03086 family metal-binding protein [Streptomyces sp. NPDC005438]|uniref:TIGR03086 family metal-binding protein n=1 Tax=Streptomyces sp. NPDC005438 TaxID=3156880 RepID=UPI0033A2E871